MRSNLPVHPPRAARYWGCKWGGPNDSWCVRRAGRKTKFEGMALEVENFPARDGASVGDVTRCRRACIEFESYVEVIIMFFFSWSWNLWWLVFLFFKVSVISFNPKSFSFSSGKNSTYFQIAGTRQVCLYK